MPAPRDPATLLVAAARLYYVEGRSQAEIAERSGPAARNVSRMLTEAQKQGIVEIRINDPAGRVHELEDELQAPFGLRDVRVAHAGTGAGPAARGPGRHPGRAAAARQPQGLDDGGPVLGPRAAVDGLRDHGRPGATTGSPSSSSSAGSPRSATRSAARSWSASSPYASGADYRFLHAPAALESSTLARRPAGRAVHRRRRSRPAARADLAVRRDRHPHPRLLGRDPRLARTSAPSEQQAFWAAEPGRRRRGPLLRRRTAQPIHGAVEDRDPRRHPRRPGRDPQRRRASPTAGPRRPASSAPCAAASSTPSSATRASRAACSATRALRVRRPTTEVP